MAVSISIETKQNSRDIANNRSNVTVTVTAKWTNGSRNAVISSDGKAQARGWVKIDGTQYDFASTFNDSGTTSGSKVICEKTVNVSHKDDGSKTLICKASYTTGVSSGTVTASDSTALVAIPRKSTLSASDGTLGTAQTLTVARQSTSFTHTITYKCGGVTGTIATKSNSTSISFTPPISLASQSNNSLYVSIVFTITTYNGDTSLGSNTKTITCYISDSDDTNPTVSISVSDATGYLSTYGGYVQNKSKLSVSVTASGKQGATIKSRTTTISKIVNNVATVLETYTGSSFTTDVLSTAGTLKIETTVIDSRGRKAVTSTTVTVLAYSAPQVSKMTVYRSNSKGEADNTGAYLTVLFSAKVSSLNNKNTVSYAVKYRKNGTTDALTTVSIDTSKFESSDKFNPVLEICTFSATVSTSYEVSLFVADKFGSTEKSSTGQTATKAWSMFYKGLGFAFGKIAEVKNALDVAWNLIARKNIYMGYYHDDEKNIFFKNNAAHTNKSVDTTNNVYPHNCKVYGGSASSPTAIGFYDTRNNKAVYVYRDYDNYVLTQTNIRQHIIEVKPDDSSTTSITATATWQNVPLKTATMDNGLNPGLDNNSGSKRFFEVTSDGKIQCNCKGYIMVSAQLYLTSLTSGDTVGAAIIKNSTHQAVFYTKSGGSAVDISVPTRVFPVAAGDKIGIQANNQAGSRGTVAKEATRTRLVVQYVG